MKLIRNILLIATGLSMASCNYLDVNTDTKDRMSLEEVFTDETYTEQWLANAYSYLTNSEFADISITGSNPFNFSDDIYNPIYKSFKEVTYGEEQWPYTWKYSYQGIRQAAIFIQNVDMCNELTSEERAERLLRVLSSALAVGLVLGALLLLWQGRGNLTLLITAVWLLVPPAAKPCRGTRMG